MSRARLRAVRHRSGVMWNALHAAALLQAGVRPAELRDAMLAGELHRPHWPAVAELTVPDDVWAVALDDPAYPPSMRASKLTVPPVLFGRGDPRVLQRRGVAVVGTRRITRIGESSAAAAVAGAASASAMVVSGLAAGCDQAGHRAALDSGVPTVAVVAGGVDVEYPRGSASLAREIIDAGGAVVSEQLPGTQVTGQRLQARNRIIVALSDAVVVAEAPLDSRGTIGAVGCAVASGIPVLVPRVKESWRSHPGAGLLEALADERGLDPDRFSWTGQAAKNCWQLAPLASGVASSRDDLMEMIRISVLMRATDLSSAVDPSQLPGAAGVLSSADAA